MAMFNHQMVYSVSFTGWWLTYPSELFPIFGKIQNVPNHQPDSVLSDVKHVWTVWETVESFKSVATQSEDPKTSGCADTGYPGLWKILVDILGGLLFIWKFWASQTSLDFSAGDPHTPTRCVTRTVLTWIPIFTSWDHVIPYAFVCIYIYIPSGELT